MQLLKSTFMPIPLELLPVHRPRSITEQAQQKREEITVFLRDGKEGSVLFKGPQFRQAWSASPDMTDGFDEHEMAILIYKVGDHIITSAIHRRVDDIDLATVLEDRGQQVSILTKWYENLYLAHQSKQFREAYRIYNQSLSLLGISNGEKKETHMFMAYHPQDQVRLSFESLQETAIQIHSGIQIEQDEKPILGFHESQSLVMQNHD
jgi:hypothetical protein